MAGVNISKQEYWNPQKINMILGVCEKVKSCDFNTGCMVPGTAWIRNPSYNVKIPTKADDVCKIKYVARCLCHDIRALCFMREQLKAYAFFDDDSLMCNES